MITSSAQHRGAVARPRTARRAGWGTRFRAGLRGWRNGGSDGLRRGGGRPSQRSRRGFRSPFLLSFAPLLAGAVALGPAYGENAEPAAPVTAQTVRFDTSLGAIDIELDFEKAPISAKNFLDYVDAGFYDGTIFHRVIPGFVIQGGGFSSDMQQKPTRPAIRNEAQNGLLNHRGTLSMARTGVVDSATSQFFINLQSNPSLNHRSTKPPEFGYAVFGRVVAGMETVDAIAAAPTTSKGGHNDVPVEPVVVISARRTP